MNPFSPVACATFNFDYDGTPRVYEIPRPKYQKGLGGYRSFRLTTKAGSGDLYFLMGGSDVSVTPETGILFPAGAVEVFSARGATHFALVADEGIGTLNICTGVGL